MNLKEQCIGRWYSILTTLGVDEKILNGKHQPCPGCEGTDRFRWTNHEDTGAYICNQCSGGDGFDLLMLCFGWDFSRSAKEIEAIIGNTRVIEKKKHDPLPLLQYVQKTAVYGPEVVNYIRGRGLNPLNCLRQSTLTYYDTDRKPIGKFPCMITKVVDKDNKPVTFNVTFLKDGKKAEVPCQKKILPGTKTITGCAVRLGELKDNCISVAEGIETSLAVLEMSGDQTWAALNAGNMEKLEIPDNIEQVKIWADNDSNFTGQRSAYILARRLKIKNNDLKVEVHIPEKPDTDWLDFYVSNN